MTAGELRALTNKVQACSEVVFVCGDGRRLRPSGFVVTCPRDADGKPEAVRTLTIEFEDCGCETPTAR